MGEIPGQKPGGMRVWEGGKRLWPPPPPHMLGGAAPHVLLDGRALWEGGGARTGQVGGDRLGKVGLRRKGHYPGLAPGAEGSDSWRGREVFATEEAVCVGGCARCLCMTVCVSAQPGLCCGVHSWAMCVSLHGPAPVPTAVSREAWLLPDCPTWAQLEPQALPWQMPDLNIWPHLPIRKGVLEPTSELEGSSPPPPRTRPREGRGLCRVRAGTTRSLESLGQDGRLLVLTGPVLPLVPMEAAWKGPEAGSALASLCAPQGSLSHTFLTCPRGTAGRGLCGPCRGLSGARLISIC